MRSIFEPLYRIAGWFSPYLKKPGWFDQELAESLSNIVELQLNATEGQDTASFEINTIGEQLVSNRGLGGFLGGTRGFVLVELDATEGQDTASFFIEVLEELPTPPAPPLVPAPLPELSFPSKVELSTREVPLPVVAVLASLFAQEEADTMEAEAEVTDWIKYDNDVLLMLVRTG